MMKKVIVKASRVVVAGGKVAIFGYDKDENFVHGLGANPKKKADWLRQGSRQDLVRVKKSYDEYHADAATEAAAI